jgi:nitroimidazol reductase NimA-like FMN-containing flavoprotein (pyridoxamine 5'-phosphate oxidase superfamily)
MDITLTPTERTRLRRRPNRGAFEADTIHAILDEGFVCHIGFVVEGQPHVIPTGYARRGEEIYVHGSSASRMLRALGDGIDVCLTVTLVDGLVLARSAFHHSMNYRSVVVFGKARLVTDDREKVEALRCFTDHIVPGRWPDLRPVTDQELCATSVLALPIREASAKIRTGPPLDAAEDHAWPVWAGVVPLYTRPGEPVPDGHVQPHMPSILVPPRTPAAR